MTYDLSLMYFGAHPDDEGSCSGVLLKYAAMGARAFVVCVTRGDGADAKIADPSICERSMLGQVRVEELRCACERLGVQPPIVLGYQDGEVEKVRLDIAARTVAGLLRAIRPTVVITHDPEGGYGHPDHIAVSRFVTRGFELAADPDAGLALPQFKAARLFYSAFPRSYLEQIPAFRERRADIGGRQLGFLGVPDEDITTEVDIKPWIEKKLEALSCHRTQFEMDPETGRPKTFSRGLSEEDQLRYFGHERFVQAGAKLANDKKDDDLFSGIAFS